MSAKARTSVNSAKSLKSRKSTRDLKNQTNPEPVKTSTHLTEVDRELYSIRIRDLEDKLSKSIEEQKLSENEAREAKSRLEKVLKDSDDVIRFLQKTIKERDDERQELVERLHGLQIARETEKLSFESRLTQWQTDYENLDQRMTSELKLLQGKLTSLEEFRLQKEELTAKFTDLQKCLNEKERELPEELERMERKTLLQIEDLKEQHRNDIERLSEELERSAFAKLKSNSRKALEENTILLKEVAFRSEKLIQAESQITILKNQNQGLKDLLNKTEQSLHSIQKRQRNLDKGAESRRNQQRELEESVKKYTNLEKELQSVKTDYGLLKNQFSIVEKNYFDSVQLMASMNKNAESSKAELESIARDNLYLKKRLDTAAQILNTCLKESKSEFSADVMMSVMEFLQEKSSPKSPKTAL